ncbi:substrate-binding domain-containing protein [Labrenzia sp. PHM005]|uniref:substrate-binding domain-containing protein n=1 Tax=Labrenzia sp. PHM005 TaxID=2590016 RepID=UPI00113FD3C0|nr:substrate-binding domain-containing protein [Labrenzia sp. PHM005]QDG74753.1 substrate-binding domain-containing protein [Labrenzia sp. PHM005]
MKLVNTLNGYAFKTTLIAGLAVFWLLVAGHFAAQAQGSSLDEFWSLAEFTELNERQKQTSDNFTKRVSADAIKIDGALEPVKIAVIYPGKQASDYWRRSLSSFEARLAEIGLPYEIGSFFSGSSSYVGNQAQLITEALKNDPDYLVFTLDALRHKPIVQRLIARGRPKVILQNITTPLKAWRDRQPFLYVGFDHVTGTELLIDYYKKRLGTKKNFAILFGPRGYVSRARGNTFLQAYSDPDSMNLKASYYVGYDRQKSRDAAERILDENPNLDFIYACSTDIALGAIDAIKSRNRQANVITNGWGGGSDELDAILKGELEVTVMRMNDDNGVAMAEAIVLDQSGKSAEIPIVFSGEFAVVSKENSAEDINELKARAFRYSK